LGGCPSVEIGQLDRGTVGHAEWSESRDPIRPSNPGGDERNASVKRDSCGARVPARGAALSNPFLFPRPLRKHDNSVAVTTQLDGSRKSLAIALSASNGEGATCSDEGA